MSETEIVNLRPSPVAPVASKESELRGERQMPGAIEQRILDNCRLWLDSLPAAPAGRQGDETTPQPDSPPDLYSFYTELCALRQELRKNHRRSHEQTQRFGTTLEEFTGILEQLQRRLPAATETEVSAARHWKRSLLLPLVELHERFLRFQQYLEAPPPAANFVVRWWRRFNASAPDPERRSLIEAARILTHHFTSLLEREGIQRIVCRGELFDPLRMQAVEVVYNRNRPDNEVIAELKGGYCRGDEVLSLAEVIVNRQPDSSDTDTTTENRKEGK